MTRKMFTHYDTQRLSQNFTVTVHILLILSKNELYFFFKQVHGEEDILVQEEINAFSAAVGDIFLIKQMKLGNQCVTKLTNSVLIYTYSSKYQTDIVCVKVTMLFIQYHNYSITCMYKRANTYIMY